MSKLLFPRFKIHRPKQSAFWVLEDIANQGPKYLMMKADLKDLRGQIDNMLREFVKGEGEE